MKIILFALVLSLSVVKVAAQTDSLATAIVSKEKGLRSIGLYVEPSVQYGQINSTFSSFLGGSGMVIFNQRLAFGISGSSVFYLPNATDTQFKAIYAGLKTEYTIAPTKRFHLSFPLLVGGILSSNNLNNNFPPFDRTPPNGDNEGFDPNNRPERSEGHNHPPRGGDFDDFGINSFNQARLLVQPGVNTEVLLAKFLKLYVGANYRFAIGKIDATNSNSLLNGVAVQAGLKIGYFDFKLR